MHPCTQDQTFNSTVGNRDTGLHEQRNGKKRKMAVTSQRLPYIVENGCVPLVSTPARMRRTIKMEDDANEQLVTPKHNLRKEEVNKHAHERASHLLFPTPQSSFSDSETNDGVEQETHARKHSFIKRAFMRMKRRSAIKEEVRDPKTSFDIVIPITVDQAEILVRREKEKGNDIKLVGKREEQDADDRIILNVGGTRHETYCSTLKPFENTRLHWIATNRNTASDDFGFHNEFFFDRHPNAFIHILNYYRTGKLHLPPDVCGPLFAEELNYWGIDEKLMEPCCWPRYIEHREAEENLKFFSQPETNSFEEDLIEKSHRKPNGHFFKWSLFDLKHWRVTKKKIWKIFDADGSPNMSLKTKIIAAVSVFFILVSILSLCLESVDFDSRQKETYSVISLYVDAVTCAWFTFEFTVRLVTCPNLLRFIISSSTILDLVTLAPYYFKFIYDTEITEDAVTGIFAVARLLRLLRFFKLSAGLHIMKQTLLASSSELVFLLSILFIAGAVFATILHFCERKKNNQFQNIPQSMWWAIVTMTTVGYGDTVPHTPIGKVIGAVCAVFSVLILALPISIIGNNFQLYYYYAQARRKLPARQTNLLLGAANPLVSSKRFKYGMKSLRSNGKFSMDRSGVKKRKSTEENLGPPPQFCPYYRRSSLIDFEAERLRDLGLFSNEESEDIDDFSKHGTIKQEHLKQKLSQHSCYGNGKSLGLNKRLSRSSVEVCKSNVVHRTLQLPRSRAQTLIPFSNNNNNNNNRIRSESGFTSLTFIPSIPNINILDADDNCDH